LRALVGHLARAGVIQPAPAGLDRVRGRLLEPFDGRALATCRTSAGDAEKARWRQYRAVWAFVEGDECRRRTILRHFGDHSEPAPQGPCCDVCDPALVPDAPAPARAPATNGAAAPGDLDAAIVDVVDSASPAVGRTRTVEILRGGRSKVIAKNSYDGLPAYGTFAHLTKDEVLERVDELVSCGRLRSTGGRFPKLART
jgi:ATP-dependent DNA helicase RecQ